MRTYLIYNGQNTSVIEVETDAITDMTNFSTVHDINFVKGDKSKIESYGFSLKVPDVITGEVFSAMIKRLNFGCKAIDSARNHTTTLNTPDTFDWVVTSPLTAGKENVEYELEMETENPCGKVVCSLYSGTLPAGMYLEGVYLKGTPTEDGVFTFVVLAEDETGQKITISCSLTIAAGFAWVTTSPLTAGTINAAYSEQLSTDNETGSVTYSLATGSVLPAGLTLSAAGLISGTPTAADTYTFTVLAEDDDEVVISLECSLTIS